MVIQQEVIVVVSSSKNSGRSNCGSGCNVRNSIRGVVAKATEE